MNIASDMDQFYWMWRNADGKGWVLDKTLRTAEEAYYAFKAKDEYQCCRFLTPGYGSCIIRRQL